MAGRESAERIALPLKVGVTGAMIVAGLGASFAPFMLAAAVKQTGINEAAAANLISSEFLAFLIMARAGSPRFGQKTDPGVATTQLALCA
jgi:hypothetical protein